MIPHNDIEAAVGQDLTIQVRVLAPEKVRLIDPALVGATSLNVDPIEDALSNGEKLLFRKNIEVTLAADAAAGSTSLTVVAITSPLQSGLIGQKIRDITGYTISLEVLATPADATALVSKDFTLVTPTSGIAQASILAADIDDLTPASYYWTAWRTNTGSKRPLIEGDFILAEKGFT